MPSGRGRGGASSSVALALLESPFFAYDDALYGSLNRLDALVKLYARGRKRRSPIVGDRAPYCQAVAAYAVAAYGPGLRVLPALQLPLDGPHPPHPLFELLLGVAVGLVDLFGCLTQVVKLA